jgi:hypothetical protein
MDGGKRQLAMNRLVALVVLFPAVVFGWGETGHRVVCQIAFDELTETAQLEVERLLDLDPDFESFAESCLFADSPERIRMIDHFMNLPRSYAAITTAECPLADTCIIPAIQGEFAVLQDAASNDADKLLAIKLLGHWVGDIHQPMHVAYQDDRGANSISVDVELPDANLHAVWDYSILSRNLGDDYRRIAADLRTTVSDVQRATWKHDSPIEWANESYQITISPSVEYCTLQQGACWYSSDNMMLNDGEPWREMAITDEYLELHGSAVAKRLVQAGVRLGASLNRVLR